MLKTEETASTVSVVVSKIENMETGSVVTWSDQSLKPAYSLGSFAMVYLWLFCSDFERTASSVKISNHWKQGDRLVEVWYEKPSARTCILIISAPDGALWLPWQSILSHVSWDWPSSNMTCNLPVAKIALNQSSRTSLRLLDQQQTRTRRGFSSVYRRTQYRLRFCHQLNYLLASVLVRGKKSFVIMTPDPILRVESTYRERTLSHALR